MLHRCHCPLMMIHQWPQWIIWILFIAFSILFIFGGVAHSTRSSWKSFHQKSGYCSSSFLYSIICRRLSHCHSLPFIYSFAFCFRLQVAVCPHLCLASGTIKSLFASLVTMLIISYSIIQMPRCMPIVALQFWMNPSKRKWQIFLSCCIRSERERECRKKTKAFCCVYIPNYYCNKLQLNEWLFCTVGDIHVRFEWMANFSRWQIKEENCQGASNRINWNAQTETDFEYIRSSLV